MRAGWKSFALKYGSAVVTMALAVWARLLLDPWLGIAFSFALPLLAILTTSWFGGLRPALAALLFGGLATDYFLLGPRGSFSLQGPDVMGLSLFIFTGLGMALLGGSMHSARRRADDQAAAAQSLNAQLEARVVQRTLELQQKTEILESEMAARMQGESQLKLLETCINRINDIVLITEAEPFDEKGHRIIYVNDAFVRRTGYSREEAMGRTPHLLQGPKTDRKELDRIRLALCAWESVRVELINYTKTGEEFWIELEIVPVADPTGWYTHWVAVERDITERKLAEEQLARLAAIVQCSDDAIIGKTLDGIVTTWNAGAEKVFGYLADEMVGQPILRVIPLDRQNEEVEILTKVRNGESVRHFNTVRQRKDGVELAVSVTVSPIKDKAGKIIGISKIARDITEHNQLTRQLGENEQRMQLATEATAVGIWEWNTRTGQIHWDRQMFRIYGVEPTPGGFVNYEIWKNAVLPEDLAAQEDALQNLIRSHGRGSLEFRIQRASDGELRYVQAVESVSTKGPGEDLWVVGTNLDITERKRMEMSIRDSEKRFRTMANSMSQLAWIARSDGFIFWYNDRWYEYTGTRPEQMEGWGWQAVHDPAALPKVMAQWKAAITSGETFDMEFPLRGADGRFRQFLTRGQPLKDTDGRVIQWFGTNTDVEEMRLAKENINRLNLELEQRVIERTAQLEEANKELESFSYSVSHDLRAPLRAVNGFAKIVLDEFAPDLPPQAQEYLGWIRDGGRQMGNLIDDLLDFSRLGRQALRLRPLEMSKLVQTVLAEVALQYAGRPMEIKVGELPDCQGDSALLKQVWLNLISNAIKYTRGRTPACIEIGWSQSEAAPFYYFVRDNGAGFDMRYGHKLFGVFQRLHRSDEFEGTGVGLAIVQRIIQRHGGRVWAESKIGQGATFRFTLTKEN